MMDQAASEHLTREHLLTLYQISGWINSSLDFDTSLDNAIDAVMNVTSAQRGFLMTHDADEGGLRVLVARNIDGETIEREGYSTTIVNEVIRSRQPILTNNAQFDDRFAIGQSIIMRGLRAILCTPMLVQDRLVGVVYVDTAMKAGVFRPEDMSLVTAVSGLAAQAIENARLYRVAREIGRLERELQMAREIQRSLLPMQLPTLPGYEIAAHWEAAREVAGDFYDTFHLNDDAFAAVIADVSDKGAPAALFMAMTRSLIRSHATAGYSAEDTVNHANDLLLLDSEHNGMFVTLYYSEFDRGGRSTHVNAGHNPPLVYRHAPGHVEFMPIGGRALGWFPDNPLRLLSLQLEPGDVILYYTDGLTDAENPDGEPYGAGRLASAFRQCADKSAAKIRDILLADVLEFCSGQAPFDDITMLVVRYKAE